MTTLISLAQDRSQAQRIVQRLQAEGGLEDAEISVLLPGSTRDQDYGQTEDFLTDATSPPSARTHGLTGGALGAAVGAGAVLLPALPGFLAAGAVATAFGALIGGLAGGALGALAGLGLPDAKVEEYRQRVKDGAYLLAVHTESAAKIDFARRVMTEEGGERIHETANAAPNS